MSFRACVIVPCYDHGAAVGPVLEKLASYGLDILVVDDGSALSTAETLRAIVARQPLIRLLRLNENGGKGVAVVHGLREALRLGFSHALQVDADGQHCLDDVARFLEKGRASPAAVVCGQPIFDAAAPKSRRFGRYVTHFWVWLETRSFAIADSMCGFRLYPLAPTVALANRVALARRMAFDIDIVVRLAWEGLPIINVPTRVCYPAGGVSHFRMLRDNLLISATHARLFLESFGHRAAAGRETAHWSRIRERGTTLGLQIVSTVWRLLGPRAARLAVLPAVVWVFLTGREARQASRAYLKRLAAVSPDTTPRPTTWNVLCHMRTFADSGIDKVAAWQGAWAGDGVDFHGEEEFLGLQREKRGALFIGSHLGNLEMVRALATLRGLARITAVVYTENSRRFSGTLREASGRFSENLLEISDFGPATAVMLKERVERGEILVIVGDRTPVSENGRCVRAVFLGQAALFPQGPVVIAHLLGCPVYLFFCIKCGGRYSIHLEPFAERVVLPPRERRQAIERYVGQYAARLEEYCRKAPLQWFNFFDFWHEPYRRS